MAIPTFRRWRADEQTFILGLEQSCFMHLQVKILEPWEWLGYMWEFCFMSLQCFIWQICEVLLSILRRTLSTDIMEAGCMMSALLGYFIEYCNFYSNVWHQWLKLDINSLYFEGKLWTWKVVWFQIFQKMSKSEKSEYSVVKPKICPNKIAPLTQA